MKSQNGKKIKYSVRTAYLTIFILFILIITILLSTYPVMSSRNVVFSAKDSYMVHQAGSISSPLSVLDRLTPENVYQVMELIDVDSFDRVTVTDASGLALYDASAYCSASGRTLLLSELDGALGGDLSFCCRYDGSAFVSSVAVPVISGGEIKGAVYLCERDYEQAALLDGIQSRLLSISAASAVIALLVAVIFSTALTARIRELVKATRVVREGRYDYRITPRGSDEVTELAEEFNNMTDRLESTEELRRRFVSDASHELRTPLASIRLLSDSIVQNENMDDGTMREFVTDIGQEAERLQRMTEKLMSLGRMDSGAEELLSRVDVKKVAERTVHLLAPLAKNRDVTVYTELEDGCYIRASEDGLYQIIFNLAENAVKYNSFGGNVFIRLQREGSTVKLVVEDTGIGIPDEDVPHIFSRFYRVDKARSRSAGGSGLGLSIVHDAVSLYGGEIEVARRETVGTRFTVCFPYEPEDGKEVGGAEQD